MIEKRSVINSLTISIFPLLGISTYLMPTISTSVGLAVSIIPSFLIIIIFIIDSIYLNRISLSINFFSVLILIFLFSAAAALFRSYFKGFPNLSLSVTFLRILQVFTVCFSFLIFNYYNRNKIEILNILFLSLSILLFLNITCYYGLGLTAPFREIEGRINLPFTGGVYGANNILIPLIFIIYFYIKKKRFINTPIANLALVVYLITCLFIVYSINARLFILTFLLIILIFSLKLSKFGTSITFLSILALPLLVSLRFFLPVIFTFQPLVFLLQRVNVKDVLTFNNRVYLWEPALNWLQNLDQGVMFGIGWRGQYFIRLVEKYSFINPGFLTIDKHLHSTTLETLISQGIFGYIVLFTIFIITIFHYKKMAIIDDYYRPLYMIALYLVIISQYDSNVSVYSIGFYLIAFLFANISSMNNTQDTNSILKINNLDNNY